MSQMQSEEIPCPFCGIGKVTCDHIPSAWSFKAKRTKTLPGSGTASKSAEVWDIKSGCSNCGKTVDEIRKAMKEGVPPDKEKLKRRYNDIMKLREELKKR